ncbi:DUF4288 domain-containing protein [Planctomycetota bacterium]|nr:DUF4288 domain-containing protein [Planctomycetota bacterium]
MSIFTAVIEFRSLINGVEAKDALMEETTWLILASDESSAKQQAIEIGKSEEHEYKNHLGDTIFWEFVEVLRVEDLEIESVMKPIEVASFLYNKPKLVD